MRLEKLNITKKPEVNFYAPNEYAIPANTL